MIFQFYLSKGYLYLTSIAAVNRSAVSLKAQHNLTYLDRYFASIKKY